MIKRSKIMEETNIITLTDEVGNNVDFEVIDLIDYEGKQYVILLPADDDEEEAGEVVILSYENEGEDEIFLAVEDDNELNEIFAIFKERSKDRFDFVD